MGTNERWWKKIPFRMIVFFKIFFLKSSEYHCCQWVYRKPNLKKKHFSVYFVFAIEKSFHEKTILRGPVKINIRVTQECWKKNLFQKILFFFRNIFNEFFWRKVLSVGVQRTDDRGEKFQSGENIFYREIWFS